eukprot:TRINITY_DN18369_c0_g1_i1.p1 TRINITY_DN18369_c0_g1~~TRINITY_DN18369_c0_g1_i1.p1  ORF type:complete len:466 (-),score=45.66 TRINITY_DN18369_c0_g1_i1:110-1507(-)
MKKGGQRQEKSEQKTPSKRSALDKFFSPASTPKSATPPSKRAKTAESTPISVDDDAPRSASKTAKSTPLRSANKSADSSPHRSAKRTSQPPQESALDNCLDGLPLPNDAYEGILGFLALLDLFTFIRVCKSWHRFVKKRHSWQLPAGYKKGASHDKDLKMVATLADGVERLHIAVGAKKRAFISLDGWRLLCVAPFGTTLRQLIVRIGGYKYDYPIDDDALAIVAGSLQKLERLDLFGSGCLTTSGLEAISCMAALRELNLGYCFQDTRFPPDIELNPLSSLSALVSLSLRGCDGLRDDSFIGFRLKDLKSFDLNDCSQLMLFTFLQQFPSLTELDLGFTAIKKLNLVCALKGLETLHLEGAFELPDSEFKKLESLLRISTLDLQLTKISSVDVLIKLRQLKTLRLYETGIEEDSEVAKKLLLGLPHINAKLVFKKPSGNSQHFSCQSEKRLPNEGNKKQADDED